MNKKISILKDLKIQLSRIPEAELQNLYLFGSQARNSESVDSDFDILILLKYKHDWKTKGKILDACYDIDLKYDILIDPHILAVEELNSLRGRQPIFINAISNGIKV